MMTVRLRYFAAARAARGRNSETLTVPDGTTIERMLAHILDSHAAEGSHALENSHPAATAAAAAPAPEDARDSLPAVLGRCSFLVNEFATNDRTHSLRNGDTVDVLPPFAGG